MATIMSARDCTVSWTSEGIGYADESGRTVIKPRFAFGFPFENGKAKVTDKGEMKEVPGSDGEYHYWKSDEWYYIDKKGNRSEENRQQ